MSDTLEAMKSHAASIASVPPRPEPPRDKNCLSYWFPKLQATGVSVPRTLIVNLPWSLREAFFQVFDGKPAHPDTKPFLEELGNVCDRIGYPAFLRTGQGSGKHEWKHTCFLEKRADLESHVYGLINWSECVDFMGLDWHTWAVREMLPTEPICVLPRYGDFPLVPEMRCFIGRGNILCVHPYWPTEAIERGLRAKPANFAEIVSKCQEFDVSEYLPIAQKVADAFDGDEEWSVDILPTKRGLYVTDMAIKARSFHWPDCPAEASHAAK